VCAGASRGEKQSGTFTLKIARHCVVAMGEVDRRRSTRDLRRSRSRWRCRFRCVRKLL